MKDFKKYYKIKATPEEVFNALTNPFTLELWTGFPATMDDKEGTEFSLWEGDIVGKNIKIEKNKKIVQEWFFGDQEEKSIVTIILHPDKNGTNVELHHTNIPDIAFENMKEDWNNFYFGIPQRFFNL